MLKLRELPPLTPPPGAWERVLATHGARVRARRIRHRVAAAAAVGAVAVAAAVYLAALLDSQRPVTSVIAADPVPPAGAAATLSYAPLVAESVRLERLLAELPAPRPLMVASTAGAIVGLEDRIAFIDTELTYAAAQDLEPTYREALWGERVELMSALVYVRFAQLHGH